ncbi:SgcJ/EcaC family oxidoreductase [Microcoleus sp. B5-D4]|uniref:SgcJ/EcaC family oxidoreductase n=1 Tax=unclassified Microcoleus TaxID=2642155 RepID=UPI002FD558C8
MNNDKDQIREIFEEVYAANVRSCDLQGYAEMYTEAAVWMPPDQPDRLGVPEIVEAFAAQIAEQDIDPIFVAEEIEVMGDFGYVVGISQATIHPKDGSASKEVKFRALWLMKKEEDIWKIARQIWNVKPL